MDTVTILTWPFGQEKAKLREFLSTLHVKPLSRKLGRGRASSKSHHPLLQQGCSSTVRFAPSCMPRNRLRVMSPEGLQSSVSKFSHCVQMCVCVLRFQSVLSVDSNCALVLSFVSYNGKKQILFYVHLLTFECNGWKFRNSLPNFEKFKMWISSRWQQPPKCRAGFWGSKSARKRCCGQKASQLSAWLEFGETLTLKGLGNGSLW